MSISKWSVSMFDFFFESSDALSYRIYSRRRLATYRAREIPLRRASIKIPVFDSEQSTVQKIRAEVLEAKKKILVLFVPRL